MKRILHAALEKWGNEAQMNQAIEECAEFIVAINHFRRGRATAEDVAGEIADVRLMMEQAAYIVGEELVEKVYQEKLLRVATKLDAAETARWRAKQGSQGVIVRPAGKVVNSQCVVREAAMCRDITQPLIEYEVGKNSVLACKMCADLLFDSGKWRLS